MKRYYIYITLIALTTLTSCASFQKYERVNPAQIEAYKNTKTLQDTTNIAMMDWRMFFNDEILIKHIDTALANNLDWQRAQQSMRIAKSLVKQSKAALLPSLNAGLNYTRQERSSKSAMGKILGSGGIDDWTLGPSLSWEIDVWGKLSSQKRAAVAQYYQSESAQQLVKSQIVNTVANYYYVLQSLDAKKEVVLSTIKNRKESIEITKALKESGNVTEVAVKQTEAQFLTAKSILLDIKNQINITENALSVVLGKAPQNIERASFPKALLVNEVLKVGVPIQILDNRPDVLLAEYSLVQAMELTNSAKASFYPSLTITGNGGLNSENFSDLFSANAWFANIAGGLLQPIFNQRKLKTQKEIRQYEQQIAFLDYKQSVLTAYQEISNELSNLTTNKEKLVFKEQEKEALFKSLEYSEELMEQGFVNYLEILRAKDLTLNAELEIIDLKLGQLTGKTNLYRALGGGWK